MPVGKRSRAHPRRDRSWEKVRQSEANLVTGIRSTPDGGGGTVPHFPDTRKSPRYWIQVRLHAYKRGFRLRKVIPIGRVKSKSVDRR